MNEEEKALYLSIKQDPNNPVFGFLFEHDKNGNTIPIKGKTLKLMPDGIPLIMDNIFLFSDDSSTNEADPFAAVRTNKTFREISNEIALQSPFGKNSIFYRAEREILTGKIPKL